MGNQDAAAYFDDSGNNFTGGTVDSFFIFFALNT